MFQSEFPIHGRQLIKMLKQQKKRREKMNFMKYMRVRVC